MKQNHTWRFFRAGGFDQVKLETGADLMALDQLDQKLWVALACPTTGLTFDKRTLTLMDTDKDGRIRVPELIAAVKWAGSMLKNADDIARRTSPLPLGSINDSTPEGKQLLESARQILANLGKKDATAISVDDTVDTGKILAQTAYNGDGIIVEESADDDATRALIRDIIACLGAEQDRGGKPGISQGKVDQFYAEARAFSDWSAKANADPTLLPLKDSTQGAAATLQALKTKIDDYFTRCQLAAFDSRATTALNREEKEYFALAAKDLTMSSAELAVLPLAQVAPNKPLPLTQGINPAWADLMARFTSEVVRPLLNGQGSLTEEDWKKIRTRFVPHENWAAAKAGGTVEKLGLKRVDEILAGNGKETLSALILKDKAEEANVAAITAVERLTRYTRDLHLLCTNFVNFRAFYDRGESAIFQAGTLYLDQRSCELTLPVEDPAKHAAMAGLAGAYLAYCDCARKGTGEKMSIVAVFSQGDDDNLMVGRNGIFYDRAGRDWDATITKLVANPISVRQAFWMPYKKFVRMIEELAAKRASAADEASTRKMQSAAETTTNIDKAKPEPRKVDVGTVAALGVAFGAIGTFVTAIATGLVKVTAFSPLALIAVLLGVMLLISGPSMILAYLKLRKRNLGPIMDANGWAVNARAMITVPFGARLTGIPKLPPGSKRDLHDPYAEKRRVWPWFLGLALMLYIAFAVLDHLGYINEWTNGKLGKPPAAAATDQSAAAKAADAAASSAEAAASAADAAASAAAAPPGN
jgi:hypothetical protein